MKKWIALLLSVTMVFLSACGAASGQKAPEFDGTEDIINKIYEQKPIELNMASITVDLTDENSLPYYTGLDMADSDKLVEATASEPMMGQACSIVVVEVANAKDTKDIAQKMANNINQAKWICMEADNLRVVTCDKYILLVMIMSDLSETVTVDEIADAFKTVCGFTDGDYAKQ